MVFSSEQADQVGPEGNVLAQSEVDMYADAGGPAVNLDPATVGATGGSQPHDNTMPFLCVNFIISLFGIFPSQT